MFALCLAISVPFTSLPPCSVSRSGLLLTKGFLIVYVNHGVFYSGFLGLYPFSSLPVYLHWSFDPPLSPHLRSSGSSHLSCPLGSEKISPHSFWTIPSLCLCLSFRLSPCLSLFSKLQWQIEVRLSTTGCFNFIDPPPEVTKAANCLCLWLKLCHSARGSGI